MDNNLIRREDNQPGMDQQRDIPNKNLEQTNEAADGGHQGRAAFFAGSAVQGGSNFGQGSHQLGGNAYHQGDEKSVGSNYANEAGKSGDDQQQESEQHGHGQAGNEKEANAQEEYPGIVSDEGREDLEQADKGDLI